MAGLQDISPMVSTLWVSSRVAAPMRAGCGRSLAAGMAAADHDDIVAVPGVAHGRETLPAALALSKGNGKQVGCFT